jgi:hypothetical protein
VVVWSLMSVVKLGRGENGERDKGEKKSEFHLWGCLAAAVSSLLVCWFIPPPSLAPLYAHRERNNIFGGATDNLWRGSSLVRSSSRRNRQGREIGRRRTHHRES